MIRFLQITIALSRLSCYVCLLEAQRRLETAYLPPARLHFCDALRSQPRPLASQRSASRFLCGPKLWRATASETSSGQVAAPFRIARPLRDFSSALRPRLSRTSGQRQTARRQCVSRITGGQKGETCCTLTSRYDDVPTLTKFYHASHS